MNLVNNSFIEPQCIADAFAQFFSSVFEKSTSVDENLRYEGDFVFPIVTEENVRLSIKKLKPKKATGVDNVPPYIYKGCIDIFVKPLVHIFNLSIETSTYPSLLKNSPIPKAGKTQNNIEHYRPITTLLLFFA